MATSHLITCKHITHFGLNSLISTLSFGEFFSYFATSLKWYCLTFWIGKKWRLFRRFFQYSVSCYFPKYIRLALPDFHKNKVFYRNVWSHNSAKFSKKIHRRKRKKIHCQFCFCAYVDVIKIEKRWYFFFERAQITWAFVISARAMVKL